MPTLLALLVALVGWFVVTDVLRATITFFPAMAIGGLVAAPLFTFTKRFLRDLKEG